jgi:hypothetical protein
LLVTGVPLGIATAMTGCGSDAGFDKGTAPSEANEESVGSESQAILATVNYGSWNTTRPTLSHLAIHAALIPPTSSSASDAAILYFGGSQHDPKLPYAKNSWGYYNTQTGALSGLPVSITAEDVFCSGHAHDDFGNLVIIGGNQYYDGKRNISPSPGGGGVWAGEIPAGAAPLTPCSWEDPLSTANPKPVLSGSINIHKCANHFTGNSTTYVVDRVTRRVNQSVSMPLGRWYPTAVHGDASSFPNEVIAIGGHPLVNDSWHENQDVDSYGGWNKPWVNRTTVSVPLYPRAFLTGYAGGAVIITQQGSMSTALTNFITPGTPGVMFQEDIAPAPAWPNGDYHFTGVLMPFHPNSSGVYSPGKIMMMGGTVPVMLDLANPAAGWIQKPRMNPPTGGTPVERLNGIATILATGDIIYTGGVTNQFNDGWPNSAGVNTPDTSQRTPEVWRDDLNRWDWASNAAAVVSRNYHSVALLMPDGRVWTAGGNKHGGYARTDQYNLDGRELRAEIFEPWYTKITGRPTVSTSTPRTLPRGGTFTITPGNISGSSVTKVALIAPGSVTHSWDGDQRYVELKITGRGSNFVNVAVPLDLGVLPAGQYMMVISKSSGGNAAGPNVPGPAYWVTYPPAPPPPPPCTGGVFCCDQWYCPPNACPIVCPPTG